MWLPEKQQELKDKKFISRCIWYTVLLMAIVLSTTFFEYLDSMGTIDNDYYQSGRASTEYGVLPKQWQYLCD